MKPITQFKEGLKVVGFCTVTSLVASTFYFHLLGAASMIGMAIGFMAMADATERYHAEKRK